ncbi:MAG: sporulation protein YqfC [Firmicutes bacterium]|nr:sporulation protein YqfC [Bacillota bacterium]
MVQGKKKDWRGGVADFFELPHELLLNLSKLTLVGNTQLLVENHRGIIEYTQEKIRISAHPGEIIIKGQNLTIKNLHREELFVEGEINALELG